MADLTNKEMELLNRIETGRKMMIKLANLYGFNDKRVIACSKELDRLIVKYQEIKIHELKSSQK